MADPLPDLLTALDEVVDKMWDSDMPEELTDEAVEVIEAIGLLRDPRSIGPLLDALARSVFFDLPDSIIEALKPHGAALVEPVASAIDGLDPSEPSFRDHFCFLVDTLVESGHRDDVVLNKVLMLAYVAEPEYAAEAIAGYQDPRAADMLRSLIDTTPVASNESRLANVGDTLDELSIPLTDDQRAKIARAKRDLAAGKPN